MIAGIETGGTKVVCGVAARDDPNRPTAVHRFATTTPEETFRQINEFLDDAARAEPLEALGIASFGPVDTDPAGERYGWITTTPKPGWRDTDVLAAIPRSRDLPTAFLNDVGSAALGEQHWGAGRGARTIAYATVGTGIGVGLVVDGEVLSGSGWPELGHLPVRRHVDDRFAGLCPYHGDCLEGLAAGPAVLTRWGTDASSFTDDVRDGALEMLASYLAQLVYTTVLAIGAERVVLGGGVMHAPELIERVRAALVRTAGGYGPAHLIDDPGAVVVPPALGDLSGVVGALTAASRLLPAVR